jgi:hypothetical protein
MFEQILTLQLQYDHYEKADANASNRFLHPGSEG